MSAAMAIRYFIRTLDISNSVGVMGAGVSCEKYQASL
jgi:hypothetical protein